MIKKETLKAFTKTLKEKSPTKAEKTEIAKKVKESLEEGSFDKIDIGLFKD